MVLTSRFPMVVVVMGCLASAADAQAPREEVDRARLSAAALSKASALTAAGDSVEATAVLKEAAARDPENGALWYAYGKLLSERTRFAFRRGIMPGGIPNLVIAAESSLARAARLSPDSIHYAIDYGRHLWAAHASVMMPMRAQKGALNRFADHHDPKLGAVAADEVGIMLWRQFEALIGRRGPTWVQFPAMKMTPTGMIEWVKENYPRPKQMYGLGLYNEAAEYFRYANTSDPDTEKYFRHEAMLLAEGQRWLEMGTIAQIRIRQRPAQPWPWLVLGISEHRLGRMEAAQAAFDSGFTRLPIEDRQRLESLLYILPGKSRAWYQAMTSQERIDLGEVYWNTANPSLLLPVNPLHAEFRARAVYAELRFSDDEQGMKGANSDKGMVYIRYGPPDNVVAPLTLASSLVNQWYYYRELLIFNFQQFRLYGTSTLAAIRYDDRLDLDNDRPAAFTNLHILRNSIDSVSTQVVRFRAGGDSVDLAIFAGFRPGTVRRGSPIDTSAIRNGVFVVDARGRPISRITRTFRSNERDTTVMHAENYFVRTSTAGQAVRIEALEPDLMQAARSVTDISNFGTRGFGLSDLLLAANITPPDSSESARWTDYRIAPFTGNLVKRGAAISLIWESYEAALGRAEGRLRVTVNVERETSKGLVAVTGRVIGGIREAITGRQRPPRGIAVSYDRVFAATPALVDHLTVDLGRLEPGFYHVTLTVLNLLDNSTVERRQRFRIIP